MFEKLKLTEKHFEEINEELCKPEIISDQNRYKSVSYTHLTLPTNSRV